MDDVSSTILEYLYYVYEQDPKDFSHFNDIFDYSYERLFEWGYDYALNQNDLVRSLDYLISIQYIECDSSHYRLTPVGFTYLINPPPNYPALSLQEDRLANRINNAALVFAFLSLVVAIASLYVAWYAVSNIP